MWELAQPPGSTQACLNHWISPHQSPTPHWFPVPGRAEFQEDLWNSRDRGVILDLAVLEGPGALCSWVSNKRGAQKPRNCCWGSAGSQGWGIPVWGINWGSAWIPVRAHRDWNSCPGSSGRPQGWGHPARPSVTFT